MEAAVTFVEEGINHKLVLPRAGSSKSPMPEGERRHLKRRRPLREQPKVETTGKPRGGSENLKCAEKPNACGCFLCKGPHLMRDCPN